MYNLLHSCEGVKDLQLLPFLKPIISLPPFIGYSDFRNLLFLIGFLSVGVEAPN